jgi:YbbR domain-containing protein
VNRLVGIVVHNWPLKLAAIGLASLLYGGLVLTQDAQIFTSAVPITVVNTPDDVVLPPNIEAVNSIRYFARTGGDRPSTSTFRATIDLRNVSARTGTVRVDVQVESVNPDIRPLSWEPRFVTLDLDALVSKIVPVRVERGAIPDGFTVGDPVADPSNVEVVGPESIVAQIVAVRADVLVQPSGIDVAQDVPLVPIDALGNARSPIQVRPATARIVMRVFSDAGSRSLPVNPIVTGAPAPGYRIESIVVDRPSVTVEGDPDALGDLDRADTDPISVEGLSSDFASEIPLALPPGVVALVGQTVRVTVRIRPETATRTFEVGLVPVGARSDLTYGLAVRDVLVTLGGPRAALDALDGSTIVGRLDVTGLGPGAYDLVPTLDVPPGLNRAALNPSTIRVTIGTTAGPSSNPSVTPVPSPS